MPKRKDDVGKGASTIQAQGQREPIKKSRLDRDEQGADSLVDYEDSVGAGISKGPNEPDIAISEPANNSEDQDQRNRILAALKAWCGANITADDDEDGDITERSDALAEVGMLLVFEFDKYSDSSAMKSELSDIESIIGGDQVVMKFINFLLSLQNQVKKANAIAAAKEARKSAAVPNQPKPTIPISTVPMHLRPAAQPVIFSRPVDAGQPWPGVSQPHQGFANFAPHAMQATPRKQESEYEVKKRQILAECTEHLKTLIEKGSKATNPQEKATILELIKKVKARMESLKSAN